MTPESIRVFIVDDHPIVRAGLREFLATIEDLEYAGEARNEAEAIALYQSIQPDVVLMDLLLAEGGSGVEAIRQIIKLNPVAAIIALSSFYEVDLVKGALNAGATSYLLKNISAAELAQAIRDAFHGRALLAQEATQALIRATREENVASDLLTDRERDVLALLVQGSSNAEIAEQLHVTVATVKFHVGSILAKLGASSRSKAVSLALRRRLVHLDR